MRRASRTRAKSSALTTFPPFSVALGQAQPRGAVAVISSPAQARARPRPRTPPRARSRSSARARRPGCSRGGRRWRRKFRGRSCELDPEVVRKQPLRLPLALGGPCGGPCGGPFLLTCLTPCECTSDANGIPASLVRLPARSALAHKRAMSTVAGEEAGVLLVPRLDLTQESSTPDDDLAGLDDPLLARLGDPQRRPEPLDELIGAAPGQGGGGRGERGLG